VGLLNTRLYCLYSRAEILKDTGKYKLAPTFEMLYSGCVKGDGGKVGKPLGKGVPHLVSTWRR
jgi:hypothetical protein